ncbi:MULTISPECIES: ligase-associated DNA damage response exonuclease [Sphingobium]|uniref:ligase-associated DNA damage response exonuclease n=1 Tax=Sphingobium TaxID=165695 RepID=UPI0015EB4846|nr:MULTISPECIES: ligase-associated DNA damage response exonuclease [Sphingobium]MCW2363446.1 putative mRNA 3-end processing factor [Sphingobium sp. B10D3B]MCW2403155.1 putative mRNA 3-end processing factor [Sphingobium sp. B10D7B]MCW2410134.1 putative mRNA 3-end processing factor [Sphingobium xanthum]
MADFSWIRAEAHGLHVVPAKAWVDPADPVETALVTHGHADHARGGHGRCIATPETLAIMDLRYGPPGAAQPVAYGETISLPGSVQATFLPAGHVLGSAQILFEHAGERVIVTGDYKRRADPTCPPFQVTPCDVFITEATFGLPVFRHPAIGEEIGKLLKAREANPDRCILVGAYALGKAQRVIAELRREGYAAPIYLHGALERMCRLYEELGVDLGELRLIAGMPKGALAGQIILCPPSALNDRWSRRLPDPVTAMASGWMRVRQRARQRNVELPLVISDHADWAELTTTIAEVNPAQTWITHGREDALLRWCELHQRRARALALVGYEDEDD